MRSTLKMLFGLLLAVMGVSGIACQDKKTLELPQTPPVWKPPAGSEELQLREFPDGFTSLAFSPDGLRLLTGSHFIPKAVIFDTSILGEKLNLLKIWDGYTGKPALSFAGHASPVLSVAYNRDGTRFASGSEDNTVKLWDGADGRELLVIRVNKGHVRHVTFSPDGTRIASISNDGIRLHDTSDGKEKLFINAQVTRVAFSPDGHLLAGAGSSAEIWDARDGRLAHQFEDHKKTVADVAFSPDGLSLLTASQDGTARIRTIASGSTDLVFRLHDTYLTRVTYSADGRWVASGDLSGTVKVWDARSGSELWSNKAHLNSINGVAFSPNGKHLASSAFDSVKVRSIEALHRQ